MRVILTQADGGEMLTKLLNETEINQDILFFDLFLPMKDGRECLKLMYYPPLEKFTLNTQYVVPSSQ